MRQVRLTDGLSWLFFASRKSPSTPNKQHKENDRERQARIRPRSRALVCPGTICIHQGIKHCGPKSVERRDWRQHGPNPKQRSCALGH